MRSAPWQLKAVLLVGVITVLVGVGWSVHARSVPVGWFAYAPPSEGGTSPRFVSTQELAAWGTAVCGLVLLIGAGGFVLGRRSAARDAA